MDKPRRTYTPEFKVQMVLEIINGKKSLGEASREYGIKDSVLSRWRQEFLERAPQLFEQEQRRDNQAGRMAELERVIGRLTVQLEMVKKSSGVRTICRRETADGTGIDAKGQIPGTPGL